MTTLRKSKTTGERFLVRTDETGIADGRAWTSPPLTPEEIAAIDLDDLESVDFDGDFCDAAELDGMEIIA